MRTIVTGATGFVGGHFLRHLKRRHPGYDVCALVRAGSPEEAQGRLDRAAVEVSAAYGETPDGFGAATILADITQPMAGVEAEVRDALRRWRPQVFWHFASSLSFDAKQKASVHKHNIEGLRHVLDLCVDLECPHFVYVSTAYTAGTKTGEISETLHDPDIAFNNFYEESKCLAEHNATAFCRERGLALTILRPSIVIGPMATKSSGGSNSGLYAMLRSIRRLRHVLEAAGDQVRYLGDRDTPLNTVPIDWLLEDVSLLIDRGLRGGEIHHLSVQSCVGVGEVMEIARRHIGVALRVGAFDIAEASPLERSMAMNSIYRGYTGQPKAFARSCLLPVRSISADDIDAYVSTYLREIG